MCHVNTTYFLVDILNFGKQIGGDTLVGFMQRKDFALDTDSILYHVFLPFCYFKIMWRLAEGSDTQFKSQSDS